MDRMSVYAEEKKRRNMFFPLPFFMLGSVCGCFFSLSAAMTHGNASWGVTNLRNVSVAKLPRWVEVDQATEKVAG